VFYENDDSTGLIAITIGAFADPSFPQPLFSVWERRRHPWLPVAGLADVLIHALHCLPELEALVMVQCAVGRGDITLAFLRSKLEGNRNGRARAVLDLVIPRADSLLEVLANTAVRRKSSHA